MNLSEAILAFIYRETPGSDDDGFTKWLGILVLFIRGVKVPLILRRRRRRISRR
jgi:hypothetical protein